MKKCTICLLEKLIDDFYIRKNGYVEPNCKDCSRERARVFYKNNKTKCISKSILYRSQNQKISREYVFDYLTTHPCIDCGENNILTLEFDHIKNHDKKHFISSMIIQGYHLNKIKKEIDKCEVRCANCHKIKTAKQQKWYRFLFENKVLK